MCANAEKTAYDVLFEAEPWFKEILQYTGQTTTTVGLAAVAAYDAALTALQGWQSGTVSQNVIAIINDLQTAFNAVMSALPAGTLTLEVQGLINVVIGVILTVLNIVTGNSPKPAAFKGTQHEYEDHVMATGMAQVQALVPDFKVSVWRSIIPGFSPADQAKRAWKHYVKAGGFPASWAA